MIFIIIIYLGVFYLSLSLGKWLSLRFNFIYKLGETTYTKKLHQLNNTLFFNPLRKAIKESSLKKAIVFIFPLILIKSIAFYFMSLILLIPLVLISQGIIMGSIFFYKHKKTKNNQNLKVITFWQLTSHIIAGSYGTIKGIGFFFSNTFESFFYTDTDYMMLLVLTLTLFTTLTASYFEARHIVIKGNI